MSENKKDDGVVKVVPFTPPDPTTRVGLEGGVMGVHIINKEGKVIHFSKPEGPKS